MLLNRPPIDADPAAYVGGVLGTALVVVVLNVVLGVCGVRLTTFWVRRTRTRTRSRSRTRTRTARFSFFYGGLNGGKGRLSGEDPAPLEFEEETACWQHERRCRRVQRRLRVAAVPLLVLVVLMWATGSVVTSVQSGAEWKRVVGGHGVQPLRQSDEALRQLAAALGTVECPQLATIKAAAASRVSTTLLVVEDGLAALASLDRRVRSWCGRLGPLVYVGVPVTAVSTVVLILLLISATGVSISISISTLWVGSCRRGRQLLVLRRFCMYRWGGSQTALLYLVLLLVSTALLSLGLVLTDAHQWAARPQAAPAEDWVLRCLRGDEAGAPPWEDELVQVSAVLGTLVGAARVATVLCPEDKGALNATETAITELLRLLIETPTCRDLAYTEWWAAAVAEVGALLLGSSLACLAGVAWSSSGTHVARETQSSESRSQSPRVNLLGGVFEENHRANLLGSHPRHTRRRPLRWRGYDRAFATPPLLP